MTMVAGKATGRPGLVPLFGVVRVQMAGYLKQAQGGHYYRGQGGGLGRKTSMWVKQKTRTDGKQT
jgi:hypothetical protein